MDKNTLIGLGLIGVILAIFTYVNQPNPEEIKKQQELAQMELENRQRINDSLAALEVRDIPEVNALPENWMLKLNDDGDTVFNEAGQVVYLDTVANRDTVLVTNTKSEIAATPTLKADEKGETISISNDLLFVEINTKGGGVTSVFLKEHQTYFEFMANKDTDKITPLQLFDSETSTNQLIFPKNGETIETGKLNFEIIRQSDEMIELTHNMGNGKSISFIYSLIPNVHHLNYEIRMNGFEGEVLAENVMLDWNTQLLQTERLLSEQRRTSTVFFKEKESSYDYLSEMSDDDYAPDNDVEWVAFKQSYFSSIMMAESAFGKKGTNFEIKNFKEEEDFDLIKDYKATMNLNIGNTGNGVAKISWYFGPNDYYVLSEYGRELEDIVNLGWGLFRWVNIYAIQPIYTALANTGMAAGLAIFLLTLVVKLFLTPIQWKMYTSSAKMRILKPEIDELNKKYPNKEDGMKKQMEMMTLYRESGASPLAGCVPMLIQMPILFAVFRFFPSTFELRQQPFLWAEDLSSFDSVLDLSFNIPFYGDHVSLFTLLMAITTLIYTVLNSGNMQQPQQPGMPNMKVIMYIFPFMMIFFFNNFASGLSYYYFLSTLISILTMVMIKNLFVNEEKLKAKMAAKKANAQTGTKKKSKFQERLEQMQKAQQEQMKNKRK